MDTYDYKDRSHKCSRFGQQSHYSCKMMVEMDKISFSERSATNPHQKHKGIFSPTISIKPLVTLPKDDPMHIDKTRFKPLMEQEKQCQHTNNLCLYCGKQDDVIRECPKKHGPHAPCTNPQPKEKQACPILVGTTRLELDA